MAILLNCHLVVDQSMVMVTQKTHSFQFSGHETFPLKQLWLMKANHYTNKQLQETNGGQSAIFSGEKAMCELGVGKNMVSSILYWSRATGFIQENTTRPTKLADFIFGDYKGSIGIDPYTESIVTAWLVHWNLCSASDKCTAFWFLFNHMTKMDFSRSDLVDSIMQFLSAKEYKTSVMSVRRAVEVCLRSYVPNLSCRSQALKEEFVEPLLGVLDLMQVKSRDVVSLKREERPSLSGAFFGYCLLDYWEKNGKESSSLDFTRLMHDVGSPGKVFRINENALVNYLEQMESLSNGSILWTDQAGIRTLTFKRLALSDPLKLKFSLLKKAYLAERGE